MRDNEFRFCSDALPQISTIGKQKILKNQRLTIESELTGRQSAPVPIRGKESELSARLLEVADDQLAQGVSRTEFARRCGLSEAAFRKYLGGTQPSADRLVTIADTAGVNVLWLAAGRGPKKGSATPAPAEPTQPLDVARLTRAIAAVQEGLQAINRTLAPQKHAELVLAAYELLESPATSASNVIKFIKAAA